MREHVWGDALGLRGFLPKVVIETGVEHTVDLEEQVEVAKTAFAIAAMVGDLVSNHKADLQRELGGGIAMKLR
jgi:hypothetical protein